MKTEWTREAVEERRQRRLAEFRQRCVEGYAEGYPARYDVTLYHDEPNDAATDSAGLAVYFRGEDDAIRVARASLTDYWQTASVHRGEYTPAVFGVSPDHFETDDTYSPIHVGPDWIDR